MGNAIEGDDTVFCFTHDYLSLSFGKTSVMQTAAKQAKERGVKKLVFINPIESQLYYTENYDDPQEDIKRAEGEALETFPDAVILKPNLVFGEGAYLTQYLVQSVLAGKLPRELNNPKDHTRYYPLSTTDLVQAIDSVVGNYDSHKGHVYAVNGSDDLTLV